MTEAARTTCDGAVLVLGRDQTGKPRAARFSAGQADLAGKAANLMSLIVSPINSPDLVEIAKKLPAGRLYANGRGFVPHVRRDLYAKVLEAAGLPDQPPPNEPGSAPEPENLAAGLPGSWDEIDVGHLVIAMEDADSGWWEAIVISIDGDMLKLRWRDFPKYKPFVRHRAAVALLKPAAS